MHSVNGDSSRRLRHRRSPAGRPHGYVRAADHPRARPAIPPPPRRFAPAGAPILFFGLVTIMTAIGIARVHIRTRVLELGGEISRLTSEQARLLDAKRRLEAERAYLRHPDQVRDTAVGELGMHPAPPQKLQKIRLLPQEAP